MNQILNIKLVQLNLMSGNIKFNLSRILKEIKIVKENVNLVIFSELSLTGYPPKYFFLKKDFYQNCINALNLIKIQSKSTAVIIGHPWYQDNKYYNALSCFYQKKTLIRYFKKNIPNYGIFNEKQYFFSHDNDMSIFSFMGYKIGCLISEDIYSSNLVSLIKKNCINILIVIAAFPYNYKTYSKYFSLLEFYSKKMNIAVIYVNQVGGDKELVFPGGSMVFNFEGKITYNFKLFQEQILCIKFSKFKILLNSYSKQFIFTPIQEIYESLIMSMRDYVKKNKFSKVVLGLSGGIDSALTLSIAVDALGKNNVQAIMMPFKYTTAASIDNAKLQSNLLGIKLDFIPIKSIYNSFITSLFSLIKVFNKNITKENLQARLRAIILMTISNENDLLVLSSSNKSELMVGYTTIYGDMCGGFAVLKDIFKTLVFKLAKYRNTVSLAIPHSVIQRAPSAELNENQFDRDVLPSYELLDFILEEYLEKNRSPSNLVKFGVNKEIIKKIIKMIKVGEYKWSQSPIGPNISIRNFEKLETKIF